MHFELGLMLDRVYPYIVNLFFYVFNEGTYSNFLSLIPGISKELD